MSNKTSAQILREWMDTLKESFNSKSHIEAMIGQTPLDDELDKVRAGFRAQRTYDKPQYIENARLLATKLHLKKNDDIVDSPLYDSNSVTTFEVYTSGAYNIVIRRSVGKQYDEPFDVQYVTIYAKTKSELSNICEIVKKRDRIERIPDDTHIGSKVKTTWGSEGIIVSEPDKKGECLVRFKTGGTGACSLASLLKA